MFRYLSFLVSVFTLNNLESRLNRLWLHAGDLADAHLSDTYLEQSSSVGLKLFCSQTYFPNSVLSSDVASPPVNTETASVC